MTEDELKRKAMVEQGHTVIANKRDDGAFIRWASQKELYTYIGRPSIWGNRFKVDEDGTRDECCDWYRKYLLDNDDLLAKLGTLRGRVLGCWCYPERCHGNELITALAERKG